MDLKFVKILGLFLVVVLVRAFEDDCCQEIIRDGKRQECVFDETCHEKGDCCENNVKLEFVPMVRQNYKCDPNCLLLKQINLELGASLVYQAYASYFQRADVSLPGIQKYFEHASLEERRHADYFIEYVNKRGGHVQLDQFEVQHTCDLVRNASKGDGSGLYYEMEKRMCICGFVTPGGKTKINNECNLDRGQWLEGLMAFEDALVLERFVNGKLLNLHKIADDLGDPHLTHLLEHDYLDEQIQAIYELGLYVTRLRSFNNSQDSGNSHYKLGEYIFDQDLAKKLDKKKKIDGMIGG